MRRLFSDKRYRTALILNIGGIIFALLGWFLNELYFAGKLFLNGSDLQMVGIILWFIGEGNLVRALLKEQTGC